MKTTLCLLACLLLLGCSASRHTDLKNHNETAPAQSMLALPAESAMASANPQPSPALATVEPDVANAPATRPGNAHAKLTKPERKALRKELKSALKEIREQKRSGLFNAPEATQNPRNNGFAIAGFVLSILGWFVLWPLIILGVIFSAIGLKSEKRGLAIAGIVIGIVGLIILLLAAQNGGVV